jgi:hypothetical protein
VLGAYRQMMGYCPGDKPQPMYPMTKSPTHKKHLRVGQVAERTGISAKALRLYEARGLLNTDAYSGSGYRLYAQPALARAAVDAWR